MTSGIKFSLGKAERLKSRKLIDLLFKQGKAIVVFPYRIIYSFQPSGVPLQAGFTVSAKNFSRAVDRNRIKRLNREAYRLQKTKVQSILKMNNLHLALFFIYTGKELPSYENCYQSTGIILDRLVEKINENIPADIKPSPDRVD